MNNDIRIPLRECNSIKLECNDTEKPRIIARNKKTAISVWNMFAFFTAFSSLISKPHEGRQALIYENYIRSGEGVSKNRIYYESPEDKRVRKQLTARRYKERLQQQVKLVRLMKKLLTKVNQDEELEQMRRKVTHIELKIEKAAREYDVSCEDMFDMDKPDDVYDIQLEKLIISSVAPTENFQLKTINEKSIDDFQASGDYINIPSLFGDSKMK